MAADRRAPARGLFARVGLTGGRAVKVFIATPLRSYTNAAHVEADGTTVDELLRDLERQFPGIRFRVVDEQGRLRTHMKVFIGNEMTRDLSTPLDGTEEVSLMQALSGG